MEKQLQELLQVNTSVLFQSHSKIMNIVFVIRPIYILFTVLMIFIDSYSLVLFYKPMPLVNFFFELIFDKLSALSALLR